MKSSFILAAAVVAAGGAGTALAQQPASPIGRAAEDVRGAAHDIYASPRTFFSPENLTIEAGGGYANFTSNGTRSLTTPGGSWTVRGVLGLDRVIGLEAGYLGSAYGLDSNATGQSGTILQNGLEALVRLGVPVRGRDAFVVPYGTVGLGWSMFNQLGADQNQTGIRDTDNIMTIPLGVGVAGGVGRVTLDARFLYRPSFFSDMFDAANPTQYTASLSTISFMGLVGYHL